MWTAPQESFGRSGADRQAPPAAAGIDGRVGVFAGIRVESSAHNPILGTSDPRGALICVQRRPRDDR